MDAVNPCMVLLVMVNEDLRAKKDPWFLWTNCDSYSVWLEKWITIVPKGGW
jgi:hypothetical protein